ncbi:MAG: hypothetical protein NVV66_00305 [Cellulomonas sp.]|uniref:hypothetical protein n=1 Tax=Cellulomonas sp. TaxID=40001 RepID=UPI0025862A47|nr:hypothetical protein [Cellulomonas sp.]MCR6703193.1 hypothetical protein [Cellulomonas sp.]
MIVAHADELDNPVYQRIVELYHDPSVLESVVESPGGTAVIVEGYDAAKPQDVPGHHAGEPARGRLTSAAGRGAREPLLVAHRDPRHTSVLREDAMSPIIELDEVTKVFEAPSGPVRAVDGISLSVERGEVFGVIGYRARARARSCG